MKIEKSSKRPPQGNTCRKGGAPVVLNIQSCMATSQSKIELSRFWISFPLTNRSISF
jgi:hypothetical protein